MIASAASSRATSTTPLASTAVSASLAYASCNDLSLGAWIGISVSCGVGGLIIGLLMAMLCLRWRSKAGAEPEPEPGTDTLTLRPKSKSLDSQTFAASPVASPEPIPDIAPNFSGLDQFLPIPTSDKELISELRSLGYLIQQHVEDNYDLSPVTQSDKALSQALKELGLASTSKGIPTPERLARLAVEPETRHATLQHIISRVLFDSISVESTGRFSMLPPSVSSFIRDMPPCEEHLGNQEGMHWPVYDITSAQ